MHKKYFNKNETIGALNQRVQFWKPLYTQNEYGEPVKSYQAQDPVWANVDYKTTNSSEYVKDTRVTAQTNVQVFIRFNKEINNEWRVVHKGVECNIISVLPDQKRRYMLLECLMDEPNVEF